jgi:AcrR family transcriptional regulator
MAPAERTRVSALEQPENRSRRRRETADGGPRQRDAARTRRDILDVATAEFAERGYSGGRVDEIAARTQTTKRMIYYYFGSKEGLWIAVLERAYATIRAAEQELDVEHLEPRDAVRRLAELTFDHHESHPDFIRLVSIENIHNAEHMRRSDSITHVNTPALDVIGKILERGRRSGAFRSDVDALDVHMMISAFCFFRVANRGTFGTLFGRDLLDSGLRDHHRRMLGDLVVSYLAG